MIRSSHLRGKYHSVKKATKEIEKAISDTANTELNMHSLRKCRDAASRMEDILFSTGGAERIVTTLRFFREKKAVGEVGETEIHLVKEKEERKVRLSKQAHLNAMIVDSLKKFLGLFQRKGGGRRTNEDQNAYDAIMAALNSDELNAAKLGRLLSRTLNVSRKQLRRGRLIRKSLEDNDRKGWIRQSSTVPKSAIGEGKKNVTLKFVFYQRI